MTATTSEAAAAAGATAGLAAGLAEVIKEAKGHQVCSIQRGDKCQDINANESPSYGDDRRDNNSDDGGRGAGGDKTHHYHNDTILQHYNQHNKSLHYLNSTNHLSHNLDDKVAYKTVPPDGGWGWMVALGTFIITTLLVMLGPCFGVLFSEYLLEAGASSTTTAWIFNLQCFLWNITGLLTRPLTQEFGWRPVALTGSAMAAVGLMISAFAPSPSFLFFSFSFMTGVGGGVVTCQCLTILPYYFQRRRGLANGIMMIGICMGQLMGPPVTRFLQDSYGFRSATLILGALALNACVGASLFHPFEWHQKKVPLDEEPQEDKPTFITKVKDVGHTELTRNLIHSPSQTSFHGGVTDVEMEGVLIVKTRLLERLGGRRRSCSSSRRSSRYNSTLSLSSLDVGSFIALPVEDEPEEEVEDREAEEGRVDNLPMRILKTLSRDILAIKSLRACILCLGAMMCINGYLNFLMMVPFAMLEAGFPPDASAWCHSLSAGCNMVTRFLVSTLSDSPRFNKRLAYMSGYVVIACTIFAFTLVSSMEWLMVTMAVFGFGIGINMGIYSIVIIDVMGVENLGPVFGTTCFFVAVGFICIGPLIGFIRDVTQSYAVSMRITGGMMLVGLTAWLFMGLAEKVDRRREESKKMKEAVQKS